MKLKLWVRIVLSIILLISDIVVYLHLGYSTSNFELLGWGYICETIVIIVLLTPELNV